MVNESALDPNDERFLRAGEYALGVLEGDALAAGRREMLADPAFADAVDWWANRLGVMAEQTGEVFPRETVWDAVERRIDAAQLGGQPSALPAPRSSRPAGWSIALAAGGAGLVAAALALFLSTPAPSSLPAPAPAATDDVRSPQLIAQLSDEGGTLGLAGVIDPAANRLALTARGFQPGPDQAPELWVVPQGGAPISLGLIPADERFERDLTDAERDLLIEGATLAVTIENANDAPHDAPTTPILVAGPLDRV